MSETRFFFRNCSCCSGSGSSGSGSGSTACECLFWNNTPCAGQSYDTCDSVPLKATVTFDYQSCSSFYGGSFWKCSGSASGLQTGVVDGDQQTGISGSCLQECPDCCDLLPDTLTFDLTCVGVSYASENLIDANPEDPGWSYDGSCLGYRPDKKAYLTFPSCAISNGPNCIGLLVVPVDGFSLVFYLYSDYWTVNSCNPIDIRCSITCGNAATSPGMDLMPCFTQCLGGNVCCVRANIVITEAMP